MSARDVSIFEKSMQVNDKSIYVDIKKNDNGPYVKISEKRNNGAKSSIIFPTTGLEELIDILNAAAVTFFEADNAETISQILTPKNAVSEKDSTTVRVHGFAKGTSLESVKELLSTVPVTALTVKKNKSKGLLFSVSVQCQSAGDAAKAVASLNGRQYGDYQLRCNLDNVAISDEVAVPPKVVQKVSAPEKTNKSAVPLSNEPDPSLVYVSGFDKGSSEDDIREFLEDAGIPIVSLKKLNLRGGLVGGLAKFESVQDAELVVSKLNKQEYHGNEIRCVIDRGADRKKISRETRLDQTAHEFKIFCSNLPHDTTEEDIKQFLAKAGHVKSVELLKRRGRVENAFVEFAEAASVYTTIAQLNNVDFKGRNIGIREYFD